MDAIVKRDYNAVVEDFEELPRCTQVSISNRTPEQRAELIRLFSAEGFAVSINEGKVVVRRSEAC